MPEQRPTADGPTAILNSPGHPQQHVAEDPADRDTWSDAEELPPRPRRRVLAPLPLALLAALAIACGFIAGVLVEKGQGSGSTSTAGAGGAFASRLAALRGASSSGAASSASSSSSAGSGSADTGSPGGTRGLAGVAGAAGGSATVGQVAYADKGTLYVTTSEGNTVKVTAAPGASVTKTVKTTIKTIHPGETVVVAGTSGANGAVSASSIRVGSSADGLGGGSALFGASAAASGASAGASSGSSSTSGERQLFGK